MLQEALVKYKGTILLVSHDIEFVRAVATSVLEITRSGLRKYPGGYDYYCEKREEYAKSQPCVAQDKLKSEKISSGAQPQKLSSKELRRQRAAERALISPVVKELKKRISAAEKKIDELQAKLDEASAELFNPGPDTDFAEANRLVRTLQFEIDRYTLEWEEASLKLEEFSNSERNV
jgi:ATP-binding cassette subfamily F protein 3